MSELTSTHCGCQRNDNNNCCSLIWIILLLSFCGNGCGNSIFNCGNDCGCDNGCGGNNCWWIIILLLFCGCGNNGFCG